MLKLPSDIDPVQAFGAAMFTGSLAHAERVRELAGRDPAEIARDAALRRVSELRAEIDQLDQQRRQLAGMQSAGRNAQLARIEAAEGHVRGQLAEAQAAFQVAQEQARQIEDDRRLAAERRHAAEEAAKAERVAAASAAALDASREADRAAAALADAVERRAAALAALRQDGALPPDRLDFKSRNSTQRGVAIHSSLFVALELPIRGMRPDSFEKQARAAGVRDRG